MLTLPRICMAPNFSPSDIAGLSLWLDAALGASVSGGNLTSLADQSSAANNATATGTIPYSATGLNGKPCWINADATYLSGTGLPISYPSNLNARMIFVVASPTTNYGGPMFQNRTGGGICSTYFPGNNYTAFANGVFTDSVDGARNATLSLAPTVAPHVYEFYHLNGALLSMAVDGVDQTVTQGAAAIAETGTAGYLVGGWGAALPTGGFVGKLGAVLVYKTAANVTAGNRAKIRAYLGSRFGISVV